MELNPTSSSDESISLQSMSSFPSPEKKKVRPSPPNSQGQLIFPNNQEQNDQSIHERSPTLDTASAVFCISTSEIKEISADLAAYTHKAPGGGQEE